MSISSKVRDAEVLLRADEVKPKFGYPDDTRPCQGSRIVEIIEMARPDIPSYLCLPWGATDQIRDYIPTIRKALRDWLAGISQDHALQARATDLLPTISRIISSSIAADDEWRQVLRLYLTKNSAFLAQHCVFAVDDALVRLGDVEFKEPLLRACAIAGESASEPAVRYRMDPDAFYKLSDCLHEILCEIQGFINRMVSGKVYVQ